MADHQFFEACGAPMWATAKQHVRTTWVTIRIDSADVVLFLESNADAFARAQRIADAINEGGRADAAPVA